MSVHEKAGKRATSDLLIHVPGLVSAYYTRHPDPGDPAQQVAFGTSGHRGSSLRNSFNQAHILAVSRAICEYRKRENISGPLFMGMDTHALSEPALITALEVFAAAEIPVMIQKGLGYTPTPVISHAILTYNHGRSKGLADGVVITPSHNPPEDGGFKYNPPHGGPAGTDVTGLIQDRANELMAKGVENIARIPFERAKKAPTTREYDYIEPYVDDLQNVVDMDTISGAGLKIGVDPMGGAAVYFWEPIAQKYGLDLEVVNTGVDPAFGFMHLDKDGKIRMDCSSPYAMAGLIDLKDRFDIAFGNDPDVDRHGIVTKSAGLLNPNHYLTAAIWYLFANRPRWPRNAAVGKTLVSTAMIDRVAKFLKLPLQEVPVGFKWFVEGLLTGQYGFAGEESAGASFLRKDGTVWSTDKDGIILNLLAAEITAATQTDPAGIYSRIEEQLGQCVYERMDAPATADQKRILKNLSPEMIAADELAGEPIEQVLTRAPANDAPIGGLKVVAPNGWFAARPSGTEEIYKIYAESFKGADHLRQIQQQAQQIVKKAFENGN
ncbi:phosphoglucomutase [Desulfosalsimonas propionicica]|uniref:Phosphoglucomutase n=1 Tax=Desulfosalsimonas propionicica TaxID=332175 RepID=A0A7W0HKJ5_9BACT|nr:phosphoglucomutase (alpha-D-glucose-1,6-bisphosphate-dependent) [Desulfosalsimonas propionicica]MBA2881344.1 phosphoglucomutase [Desulfosalsimonas propionicica]